MKIKHLLMMAAAVAMVIAGCKKDEPATENLTVAPEALEFDAAGGTKDLTVTTNLDWTVEGVEHFTLDKTSGKGNATVKVSAPAANSADVEKTITFKAGSKTVKVKLTQKGGSAASTISVNPASLDFPAANGGMKVVKVTASDKWTVSFDATWIKTTAKGGSAGEGKDVPFSCEENTAETGRTAVVTFTCGNDKAELTIKQAGAKDVTKITTAKEFIDEVLGKFHNVLASADTTYNIMNDLDFSGLEITYSAPVSENQFTHYGDANTVFYANINGNGHTIKNLKGYSWLICKNSGIIKDLTFDESCSIEFSDHSGGMLCEANYGGKLINIVNKGSITINLAASATLHYGGITGINRAYMEGCKNYGPIVLNSDYGQQVRIGGLVGSHAGSPDPDAIAEGTNMYNCENHGSVTVNGTATAKKAVYLGGIVGFVQTDQAGIISKCKNTGKLMCTSTCGDAGAANYVGGITGCVKHVSANNIISECENTGDVTVKDGDKGVGGLIGYLYQKLSSADYVWAEGCKVNCTVSAVTAPEEAGASPCNSAGLVFGKADAQTFSHFVGTESKPIQVAGKLVCGTTSVDVTADNVKALSNGAANVLDNMSLNVSLLK